MNARDRAEHIYHQSTSKSIKIKLLLDLMLDCYNEMEAAEQNMHPEVEHNVAEGYRLAEKYLRKLGYHSF